MARYIDVDALIKYPIRANHCDKKNANEHFIFGIESVIEYAENLPTADVAPVVHGRWGYMPDRQKYGVFCSACGSYSDNKSIYCPWCGAKMDAAGVT